MMTKKGKLCWIRVSTLREMVEVLRQRTFHLNKRKELDFEAKKKHMEPITNTRTYSVAAEVGPTSSFLTLLSFSM